LLTNTENDLTTINFWNGSSVIFHCNIEMLKTDVKCVFKYAKGLIGLGNKKHPKYGRKLVALTDK